jgi:hypothetical protein
MKERPAQKIVVEVIEVEGGDELSAEGIQEALQAALRKKQ